MALSHEALLAALFYEPLTGFWFWKAPRKKIKVGDRAGTLRKDGRRTIGLGRNRYLEARLAWFYMTGKWPAYTVDHRDTDVSNGRWGNLREATHGQQRGNTNVRVDSSTGVKGISPHQGGFRARVKIKGKTFDLGAHSTKSEAAYAYAKGADSAFGEFSRY